MISDSEITKEITPIIRSVGERTTENCRSLLSKIFPIDNIIIINEFPFEKAILEGYKQGIKGGRKWTLIIDADVLPYIYGIDELLKHLLDFDENTFVIYGQIIDFAWCGLRDGGIRIYRTSMLTEALKFIPETGTKGRPESAVLHAMKSHGKPFQMAEIVIGIHDYEQYFKDIFRKGIQHESKHTSYKHCLESLWRKKSVKNPDYLIALMGLKVGEVLTFNEYFNIESYPEDISQLINLIGLKEKKPLMPDEISTDYIEEIIKKWEPSFEYNLMMERIIKQLSTKKIYHPSVILWYLKCMWNLRF